MIYYFEETRLGFHEVSHSYLNKWYPLFIDSLHYGALDYLAKYPKDDGQYQRIEFSFTKRLVSAYVFLINL